MADIHAKRVTIMTGDIPLTRRLREERVNQSILISKSQTVLLPKTRFSAIGQ